MLEQFSADLRVAVRSLLRNRTLTATVVATLALGIGANAAVFSVVRGVLLRPLVNRDEDRLVYIRQRAPGIGVENTTFSMPEVKDLAARATTIKAFGDFSTVDFAMTGGATAVNHKLWWTEQRIGSKPRRIIGVVADVDDENVVPVHVPDALPILAAAAVLACAGVLASLMPAARASHVDVMQALRSE